MTTLPRQSRPPLVIWRDTPLDIERGFYSSLSTLWRAPITVLSTAALPPERSALDWGPVSGWDEHTLETDSPVEEVAAVYELDLSSSLHVFYGIKGAKQRYLHALLQRRIDHGISLVAERPTVHTGPGAPLINRVRDLRYQRFAINYRARIAAFFAMGTRACEDYRKLGFDPQSLYPFMYPVVSTPRVFPPRRNSNAPTRFIYLGRVSKGAKGADVLLRALLLIPDDDLTIDLVGGYGDMLESFHKLSRKDPRVRLAGSWSPETVVSTMSEYDCAVVPSRYDGWNTIVGQAITAGIATITTSEATSDELVSMSGSGAVVQPGNARALANAMSRLAKAPLLLEEYKANTRLIAEEIQAEVLAPYFIHALEHSVLHTNSTRPAPPWKQRSPL